MPSRYAATATVTTSSTPDTVANVLSLQAATTVRPRIYDLVAGSSTSPADNVMGWVLQRFTGGASGGTSLAELKLDEADPDAESVALQNPTVTLDTAKTLLEFWMNQRSTFRWIASPGGELLVPAAANNGIGAAVRSKPGGSVATALSIYWME